MIWMFLFDSVLVKILFYGLLSLLEVINILLTIFKLVDNFKFLNLPLC